jgi:Putative Ig domain
MAKILFLAYFSFMACATLYLTCTLWLAEPKDVPALPTASGSNCNDKSGPAPQIDRLDPASVAIGENNSTIAIVGCNLPPDPKVKFNGQERISHAVDDHKVIAQLQTSDFAAPGNTLVTVERATKDSDPQAKPATSNLVVLSIKTTSDVKASWTVWGVEHLITLELRLILMVIFVGAFAATISGMKSFGDYVGEDKLNSKWYWFYYAEPIVGAGLAFVFYLVMRGGLLTGTSADIKAVNPYGFAAISALVGMFSDAAFRKLNEVFDTLFQAKDTRSDKLTVLAITTTPALPSATSNTAYRLTLQAAGGKSPFAWSAVTGLPPWLTLSANGELGGMPTVAAGAVKFTIQVKDASGVSTAQEFSLSVL